MSSIIFLHPKYPVTYFSQPDISFALMHSTTVSPRSFTQGPSSMHKASAFAASWHCDFSSDMIRIIFNVCTRIWKRDSSGGQSRQREEGKKTPLGHWMSSFVPLLSASAQSVFQIFVVASAGALLEYFGLVGKPIRNALSKISVHLLLPCLLFVNVAKSISLEALQTLYILPLFAFLYLIFGFLLSITTVNIFTKRWYQFGYYHFLISASIGNHGYIPLSIAPAVVYQNVFITTLSLTEQLNTMIGYIALFIIVINMTTWSVGPIVLRQVQKDRELHGIIVQTEEEKLLEEKIHRKWMKRYASILIFLHLDGVFKRFRLFQDEKEEVPSLPVHIEKDIPVPDSSRELLSSGQSESSLSLQPAVASSSAQPTPTPIKVPPPIVEKPPIEKLPLFIKKVLETYIHDDILRQKLANIIYIITNTLTPPVVGSMSGVIVGIIPPLKNLLFSTPVSPVSALNLFDGGNLFQADSWVLSLSNISASFNPLSIDTNTCVTQVIRNVTGWYICPCYVPCFLANNTMGLLSRPSLLDDISAPLSSTLTSALLSYGNCTVPITTFILGSNVVDRSASTTSKQNSSSENEDKLHTRTMFGIILIRLFLMPVVGILLVTFFVKVLGAIDSKNDLLIFTLLLQASTPTAMNLQLISEMVGAGQRAMARAIAISYTISIFTLTIWITVYLFMINEGFFSGS
jgi:predicted permease